MEWAFSLPVPERAASRFTEPDSSISSISYRSGPSAGDQPGEVVSLLEPPQTDEPAEGLWAEGEDETIARVIQRAPTLQGVNTGRPPIPPGVRPRGTTGALTPPAFGPPGPNPADLGMVTFRDTRPPPIVGAQPTTTDDAPPLPPPRPRRASYVPVVPLGPPPPQPLVRWKSVLLVAVCVTLAILVGVGAASLL
jgi:hypothetical protein